MMLVRERVECVDIQLFALFLDSLVDVVLIDLAVVKLCIHTLAHNYF